MRRRRVIFALLIIVVVAVAAAALFIRQILQQKTIVQGVPSGELAYTSNRDGNWDLFTIDSEGTVVNLTADGDGQDYFPSFPFSADMVNFLTGRTGEMGPGQVRPDGSDLHTLGVTEAIRSVFLEGRLDWDPNWSPDSTQMIWASLRDLNLEVYIGDNSGENRRRLTNDAGRDWFMTWSPDGSSFVFNSDRAGSEDVYLYDLATDTITQLTDHPADDIHPMWSLDGETILFARDNNMVQGQLDLMLMNADGSNQRPLGDDELFEGDPTYSADGAQVAYASNKGGVWGVYVMDADGDHVRRVTTDDADALFPVWRPIPEGED